MTREKVRTYESWGLSKHRSLQLVCEETLSSLGFLTDHEVLTPFGVPEKYEGSFVKWMREMVGGTEKSWEWKGPENVSWGQVDVVGIRDDEVAGVEVSLSSNLEEEVGRLNSSPFTHKAVVAEKTGGLEGVPIVKVENLESVVG